MKDHQGALPPPLVLSLIVCEKVIQDAMTGQHSIIGTLASLQCPGFPVAAPQLCVFLEMTNGRGQIPLKVRIVDCLEERPPVFEAEITVQMDNPLAVTQAAVAIGNLVFSDPGEYRIQLYASGELLLERRLLLQSASPPQPPPTEPVEPDEDGR